MFKKAELEVVEFEVEDVIATSGGTIVSGPEDDIWGEAGGSDTSTEHPDK